MKRFEFRLERLLGLKRQEADAARLDVSHTLRSLQAAERLLADAVAKRRQAEVDLASALGGDWSANAYRLLRLEKWLSALIEREAQASQQVHSQTGAYESARQELARRERRAQGLERVREERVEEWRSEYEKDELALMEETATVRFIRNQDSRSDDS